MAKSNINVNAAMNRVINRFKETICKEYAVKAEQMAKDNTPWTDRTGDAKKLLKGYVLDEEDVVLNAYNHNDRDEIIKTGTATIKGKGFMGFGVAHRVEYGKYLETVNSNKYAVLKPIIEALRADFLSATKKVFGGNA